MAAAALRAAKGLRLVAGASSLGERKQSGVWLAMTRGGVEPILL